MKENSFSAQFRKELREYCDGHNIPIHINLIVDAPRSLKKPYDAYFVVDREFVALEFKVVNGASVSEDKVTPHQIDKLTEVFNTGSEGYIVILIERLKRVYWVVVVDWIRCFRERTKRKIEDFDEWMVNNVDDSGYIVVMDRSREEKTQKTMWEFNRLWLLQK